MMPSGPERILFKAPCFMESFAHRFRDSRDFSVDSTQNPVNPLGYLKFLVLDVKFYYYHLAKARF